MSFQSYKRLLLWFLTASPFLLFSQALVDPADSLNGFDEPYFEQASRNYGVLSNELPVFLANKKRQHINARFGLNEPKSDYKLLSPLSALSSINIDFETANMSNWTVNTAQTKNSTSIYYCCVTPGGKAHTVPSTANDPKGGFNLTSPLGGNQVAKIGNDTLVSSRMTIY